MRLHDTGFIYPELDWFFIVPKGRRPKPATPLHAMLFYPVQLSRTQPLVVQSSFDVVRPASLWSSTFPCGCNTAVKDGGAEIVCCHHMPKVPEFSSLYVIH